MSLSGPHTEIILKGKASKPTEFGKLVQIQKVEHQVITHYEVFDCRPSDRDLLLTGEEARQTKLGRLAQLVAADAGCYSLARRGQLPKRA